MQIVSLETICMNCQILLCRENKKNINLSSAEFAQRVVKVYGFNLPSIVITKQIYFVAWELWIHWPFIKVATLVT